MISAKINSTISTN